MRTLAADREQLQRFSTLSWQYRVLQRVTVVDAFALGYRERACDRMLRE